MSVEKQLKRSRLIHVGAVLYNVAVLTTLWFGYYGLTATLVSISLLGCLVTVYKLTKLLKSPFLYLAEIEAASNGGQR